MRRNWMKENERGGVRETRSPKCMCAKGALPAKNRDESALVIYEHKRAPAAVHLRRLPASPIAPWAAESIFDFHSLQTTCLVHSKVAVGKQSVLVLGSASAVVLGIICSN